MSSARVLSAKILKTTQVFVVVFALLIVWAVIPTQTRASTALTAAQVQAVVGLLQSFNVDSETVGAVEAVLEGVDPNVDVNDDGSPVSNISKKRAAGAVSDPSTSPKEFRKEFPQLGLPAGFVCSLLQRNLSKGSSGEDVLRLQAYLEQTGDLTASTTGYFGEKTEAALKMWQARMKIASSGDASTTGFGFLGPRTRNAIMTHCKELMDKKSGNASSASSTIDATKAPTCVLRANKEVVANGGEVVLYWDSKNATYASSASGEKGPVYGSVKVMPTETTTYAKKVYGPGGEGQCTVTITVGEDTTPAAEIKVVMMPIGIDFGRVFSLMGSGMAAVMDGYLSLFGLSLE